MSSISKRIADMSPMQVALATQRLESQREVMAAEPLALVGMSCRFPGANNPQEFWQLLLEGKDVNREVPADRWDLDAFFDADPKAPGKMYTRSGAFLDQIDMFDPRFFGISPREARTMDPQQRLLLEVTWETLENAFKSPDRLVGSSTGVFVGLCSFDFSYCLHELSDPASIDLYYSTGSAASVAAGRLSYALGLTGPCVTVDTACSSSLVAVHLACQALRARECDLALAGGVNVMASPQPNIIFCKAGMLSRDGRCHTFDQAAEGYGRGEGCGMIAMRRLSDAVADGDSIIAVIRGSAVNQDGPSGGLTVPSGPAQQAVMRRALDSSGVHPSQVSYIEAHGTGTKLGDPIEVNAVGAVMGQGRSREENPLLIGAVKTNIGHLEAAAGIASIIKVALSLQHGVIPAHLNFETPSPFIDWQNLPCVVPTKNTPWPATRRIAGISSFGYSGTNAHVLMEGAPASDTTPLEVERPRHLLVLSARTQTALEAMVTNYRNHLDANPNLAPGDVCASAGAGRAHFKHRLALTATSTVELRERLAGVEQGDDVNSLVHRHATDGREPSVAFLFTGQGSQYVGMGRELYETHPAFRKTLNRCAEILDPYLPAPLLQELYSAAGTASRIDETAFAQPALFALEYSLAELWRSWGVKPSAVLGHSVGEYVAACVAGVFSLEDGLKLIAQRGAMMQSLPKSSAMAAVHAAEAQVRSVVAMYSSELAVAAVNGPENTVISGSFSALKSAEEALAGEGIHTERLAASHGFHSPQIDPILGELEAVAGSITLREPQIPLISNLTGEFIGKEIMTADYWRRHARQPVRFQAALETVMREGCQIFLEIGPKATLVGIGRGALPEQAGAFLPSLRPGRSDWEQMLASLAELYVRGVDVDWQEFDRAYPRRFVSLPTYPFERQRFWPEATREQRIVFADTVRTKSSHALLGERVYSVSLNENEALFESRVARNSPSFLQDHCVFGQVILPATAFLEIGLAAGAALFNSSSLTLADVEIRQPLILAENEERTVQTLLSRRSEANEEYSFKIFSTSAKQEGSDPVWILHLTGRVSRVDPGSSQPTLDLKELKTEFMNTVPVDVLYGRFAERGLDYGPAFRRVVDLRHRPQETLGRIELADPVQSDGYHLHPALTDGCLQAMGPLFDDQGDTYLPVGIERLRLFRRAPDSVWCRTRIGEGGEIITGELDIVDSTGALIAQIEGMSIRRADPLSVLQSLKPDLDNWFYEIAWRAKALSPASDNVDSPRRWLIIDSDGLGIDLGRALEKSGDNCIVARAGDSFTRDDEHSFTVNLTSPEEVRRLFKECGKNSLYGCVYLSAPGPNEDSQGSVRVDDCAAALHVAQALADQGGGHLSIVTTAAQQVENKPVAIQVNQAALWGLGRVISAEGIGIFCSLLDLDPAASSETNLSCLLENLKTSDGENQIVYRSGVRHVARLAQRRQPQRSKELSLEIPRGLPYRLQNSSYGTFDNLRLVPMQRIQPRAGEIEIEVKASGLNFRDLMHALGMLQEATEALGITTASDLHFGLECSGIVSAVGEDVSGSSVGDEVMALAWGGMNSFVTVQAKQVVAKPPELSFEEAATIPLVYLTALYGLEKLAKIRAGDRVLIHAAAGGVGQAALQIAQRAGAEVFATASRSKWQRLRSQGVHHVMDSRSLTFSDEILALTGGEGVDVVLNSLSGDFIAHSLSAMKNDGRFVEIGKVGVRTEEQVRQVKPDASYFLFDLGQVAAADPSLIATMLRELFESLVQRTLAPPIVKSFPIQDAVAAFRFMARASHYGKIVLTRSTPPAASAPRNSMFHSDATYLITGGLGALGLEVAQWLASEGAGRLVLASRSAPTESVGKQLEELRKTGVELVTTAADVSQPADAALIVQTANSAKQPLRGIFHAAGVLDDAALIEVDWERFQRVMAPKADGSWNLHSLTREMPLDFFICFSSVSAIFGTPGQGSYAAANAFMDALAHHRRVQGLPALSVNWGPWARAGMAARMDERQQSRLTQQGFSFIDPKRGIQALAELLRQDGVQVAALPVNWTKALGQFPLGTEPRFFAEVARNASSRKVAADQPSKQVELLRELTQASAKERFDLVFTFLQKHVTRVLGINAGDQLDPNESLAEMGLDSLMGIELKSRIGTELGVDIPLPKFARATNLSRLAALIVEQLELASILPSNASESDEDMEEIIL